VLEAAGRSHIVAVTDLSPEGAFLSTRVAVSHEQPLRLKMILPRDGREVAIACQLVRSNGRFDPASGLPAGIAVRFLGLDAATVRRVEEFAMEGFLPAARPIPAEHFEYRLLERPEIDAEELNRLGLDGWQLASALSTGKAVRMILLRRL
jgi:hypothetical protein